jgi:hypothetical protein
MMKEMWRKISIFLLMILSLSFLVDFSTSTGSFTKTTLQEVQIANNNTSPEEVPVTHTTDCNEEGCQDHHCHFGHCRTLVHKPAQLKFIAQVVPYSGFQNSDPVTIYLPHLIIPPISA